MSAGFGRATPAMRGSRSAHRRCGRRPRLAGRSRRWAIGGICRIASPSTEIPARRASSAACAGPGCMGETAAAIPSCLRSMDRPSLPRQMRSAMFDEVVVVFVDISERIACSIVRAEHANVTRKMRVNRNSNLVVKNRAHACALCVACVRRAAICACDASSRIACRRRGCDAGDAFSRAPTAAARDAAPARCTRRAGGSAGCRPAARAHAPTSR